MDLTSLKPRIMEILRSSDLDSVSVKQVRNQLQQETDIPLDEHKAALKAMITECYDLVSAEKQNDSSGSDDSAPIATKPTTKKRKAEEDANKKKAKKARKARQQDPDKREKNNFTRTWILSPELAAVTGEKALSRPAVVKHLWRYIKENNLQDPKKKTHIFCDEKLKRLFNNEEYLSTFTMNKYIGKHLVSPAVTEDNKTE